MPCRAACQLLAFQHNDIRNTSLGQVVGNRTTLYTTTNNVSTTTIFIADQSNGMSIYTLDPNTKAPVRRGALPLRIPAGDCLESENNNANSSCVTVAKNIEVRGNLVYVTTDMGMFVVVLNF